MSRSSGAFCAGAWFGRPDLSSHENRNLTADRSTGGFTRQVACLLAGPAASAAVVADCSVTADRVVAPHGHFIGVTATATGRSRQRLAIPDDRFVFLYFGGLRPYKGVDDLIASFTQLAEPRTLLVVAGRASDPGYAETLRRRVSSSDVTFVDRFIPDESVQWFFNASDVVVLPFREILTSSSLLLAMSFGRMVVAPRLGCVPDYADPSCNVIYEPAVPDALTNALRATLMKDVDAYGRSNLEAVRRFDWDDSAARTAAVYRNLVAH
jgi:glycosyltransferase involved in cell wall biosynthesis